MDPLSALIGGAASIFGGLMNSSSQQAINSANLQQSMYMANNAVSMRVADARRAGINPLAALGVSTPGFVGAAPTDPGAGVGQAGTILSKMADPQHLEQMKNLEETKAAVDIANARTMGNNAAIEGARNMWILEQMQYDKARYPDATITGVDRPNMGIQGAEWMSKFWNNPFNFNWKLN